MILEKVAAFACAAVVAAAPAFAADWPRWNEFKSSNIENGRVIDFSDKRLITTSEGQSYAMFFALAADDRMTFAALSDWSEANLSEGNIGKTSPAWLWGAKEGVIDSNNATDSDMWIAYCYLEAGRLWGSDEYRAKGLAMLENLKREVREVPNLGSVLLPGRWGFEKDGNVKLNPSYYPMFLFRRFALEDSYWNRVAAGSLRSIVRSAPSGIAPDWAHFDKNGKFVPSADQDSEIGSYNAIRTYMWAGMTSRGDASLELLKKHFAPMIDIVEELGVPARNTDILTLKVDGAGAYYFGACVLALLDDPKIQAVIRTRLAAQPVVRENYYESVLTLFGQGFDEGRFRFDADGHLILKDR